MDILVLIWAALSYVYDFAKDTVASLAQPFVLGMVFLLMVINSLKKHLDYRLDRLERRLSDIEDRLR